MKNLETKHCLPCEGGIPKLSSEEIIQLLKKTNGWELTPSGNEIFRNFQFKNFSQVMQFINAIAWIAEREQHHPDVSYGYNSCTVRYSTHAIQALSENDFICASKINQLFRL